MWKKLVESYQIGPILVCWFHCFIDSEMYSEAKVGSLLHLSWCANKRSCRCTLSCSRGWVNPPVGIDTTGVRYWIWWTFTFACRGFMIWENLSYSYHLSSVFLDIFLNMGYQTNWTRKKNSSWWSTIPRISVKFQWNNPLGPIYWRKT